jgi:hypothetical protein
VAGDFECLFCEPLDQQDCHSLIADRTDSFERLTYDCWGEFGRRFVEEGHAGREVRAWAIAIIC